MQYIYIITTIVVYLHKSNISICVHLSTLCVITIDLYSPIQVVGYNLYPLDLYKYYSYKGLSFVQK